MYLHDQLRLHPGGGTDTRSLIDKSVSNISLFVQFNIKLTEAVTINLALHNTWDRNRFSYNKKQVNWKYVIINQRLLMLFECILLSNTTTTLMQDNFICLCIAYSAVSFKVAMSPKKGIVVSLGYSTCSEIVATQPHLLLSNM